MSTQTKTTPTLQTSTRGNSNEEILERQKKIEQFAIQQIEVIHHLAELTQAVASDLLKRKDVSSMSTAPTREEIDTKLAANVAEVKAVASEMRSEMTALRADNHTQFVELRAFMEVQASKTEAAFSTLGAKIDGVEKGLDGKIDGLDSSITMGQWAIGVLIAVFGILVTIGGIWIGYLQLKQAQLVTPVAAPPAAIVQQAQTTHK